MRVRLQDKEYPATYLGETDRCRIVVRKPEHNLVMEGEPRKPGECHPPLPAGVEVIEW